MNRWLLCCVAGFVLAALGACNQSDVAAPADGDAKPSAKKSASQPTVVKPTKEKSDDPSPATVDQPDQIAQVDEPKEEKPGEGASDQAKPADLQRWKEIGALVETNDAGQITLLVLGFTKIGDRELKEVGEMSQLEVLAIDHNEVTDAGLAHLSGLTKLTELRMGSNDGITAAGLKHITGLQQLERLDLIELPINDDSLSQLSKLMNLTDLNVEDTEVTLPGAAKFAAGRAGLTVFAPFGQLTGGHKLELRPGVGDGVLAQLKEVPTLKELSLWECHKVTDESIKHVLPLKDLEKISLGWTQITDAALAELSLLPNLKHIDLEDTNTTTAALVGLSAALPQAHIDAPLARIRGSAEVTLHPKTSNDDAAALAKMPGLTRLSLWRCDQLTAAALEEFAKVKTLKSLNLGATEFDDAGLAHLQPLAGLEQLVLANCKITDEGLQSLAELDSLVSLKLDSTPVTSEGLKHLHPLANLQTLSLAGTKIDDAGLPHLAKLPELTSLDLSETTTTGSGLAALVELPKLQSLNLALTLLTNESAAELAKLPHLTSVDLTATQINDEGLKHLTAMKNLIKLNLVATDTTEEGISQLEAQLPGVETQ